MAQLKNNATLTQEMKVKKFSQYFVTIKEEILKINWTTPRELEVYTKVTVLAAFILGIFIYFNDLILGMLIRILYTFINAIMR